jgi:glycosyltransferase involved in cell wall biosynthesis
MQNRLNLLMFVDLVWDGTWYSRHHLIRGLAQRNRVTIVDSPVELRTLLREPLSVFRGSGLRADQQDTQRYSSPRWLPEFYRGAGVRRALSALRARSLSRHAARADMGKSVVYAWLPDFQEAASQLDVGPLVYHAYDKYDKYEGSEGAEQAGREEWLARNADLCVAPSTELANYLRNLGAKRVLELPHAVDVNLFRPDAPIAPELASIPRPILGLVARLNEVLDTALLSHIATARPDWSIVLVGAAAFDSGTKKAAFDALCQQPNVFHVGQRSRSEIPSWLCGFDVGLMCYVQDAWGPYVQPIKMYEYLACGLPIVSTNIVAARQLSQFIRCCETQDDWIPQLERALTERSAAFSAPRIAFAEANSWEHRVATLDQALHDIAG